jgi:hypothetical protein
MPSGRAVFGGILGKSADAPTKKRRDTSVKRLYKFLPFMLALGLVACAQPPKAEIAVAEAAFAKAQASPDVAAYAPEALARAEKAIALMREEVAAKRYDKAKDAAVQAKAAADGAVAAVTPNKERAKAKADETLTAARSASPEAEKLLADASRVKKAKLDIEAETVRLKEAQASLASAEEAYAKGDYLAATSQASAAQKAFADLQAEIAAAVQGATRKK